METPRKRSNKGPWAMLLLQTAYCATFLALWSSLTHSVPRYLRSDAREFQRSTACPTS